MATMTEHLIKLTDHRDRDRLELTLAKALIDLAPIERVVISRLTTEDGEKRWLELVSLDARGGGRVADPLRIDFQRLARLEDAYDRLRCLRGRQEIEVAWAGENGPRIYYLPIFADSRADEEEGVIEVHTAGVLTPDQRQTIDQLHRIYRNMYTLLAYSDRDPMTGLLNRKSLDDTFYSAVLEELDGHSGAAADAVVDKERRHRVPPNYWLGSIVIDHFHALNDKYGNLIVEEVVLLLARIMNSTFRTHDRLYRFGGDQFAALFHCPDEAVALSALERLRANVERYSFPQVGSVTVSVGLTRVQSEDTPSSALERTGQAIDHVQREGGNQVCSHPELVRRGVIESVTRTGSVDVF